MPMSRRKRRAYPSDLTHGQWAVIEPMIPEAAPGGRPRRVPKREIVEAILHLLRAGCSWRILPHDFPPSQTVYRYLRRWEREGAWTRAHHAPVMADRERAGREASPSAAIIDSQTVRTADRKGGSKAATPERRSMGASATS
jgi:transposase